MSPTSHEEALKLHEEALNSAATQDLAETLKQPLKFVRRYLAHIRKDVTCWRSLRPLGAKDRARRLLHLTVQLKRLPKRAQELRALAHGVEHGHSWAMF